MLVDPDNLDFRISDESSAKGYGCETYYIPEKNNPRDKNKTYESIPAGKKIELEGIIDKNTLISAERVSVTDDIIVDNGSTLSISAGTVFSFEGPYNIFVKGTVIAEGTADKRIVFTSSEPDPVEEYSSHSSSWGGMVFDNTLSTNDSSSFKYCVFEYAKSVDSEYIKMPDYLGGAVLVNNFSKLVIENCIFRYNTALYAGAIAAVNNSNIRINNNLIYENYAKHNGSIAYFLNSNTEFYNNTAINNIITDWDLHYERSPIFNFRSRPLFINNIIRDNISGIHPQIYYNREVFTHSNNIEGIENYNGNFNEEPLFDGLYVYPGMLLEDSPGIDMGVFKDMPQPEYDIAGNSRISNGRIDVGAYEIQEGSSINENTVYDERIVVYPNPSNPSTTIVFRNHDHKRAEIFIYDLKGSILESITLDQLTAGLNKYNLKLDNYSAGMYIVRIFIAEKLLTGKIIIVK